ncbi:MAG TPA: class I SAM-dependent methyltransferase [Gaiellaceae bacterium]
MEREDWNRRHGEAEGPLFGVEPNRFLAAEVAALAPGRALDLACGAGRNAVWLAERGWTVTGVDFSDVALEHARRLAEDRGVEVEWVQADVREWAPAAAAFDLVAILYLQIPVGERRVVHGRAAAAVAPGGTLLVVGHDRENLRSGTGGPKDVNVLLDADEVAGELGGLAIERAERVLRPVEGERDAIDTLVRARRVS